MKKAYLLLIILLSAACTEDSRFRNSEYPLVITELGEISTLGAEFKATVINKNENIINESGFIFKTPELPDNNKLVVENAKNEYSYVLRSDIPEGALCYVRAYILTDNYLIYGNELSFISEGFIPEDPVIDSISPAIGKEGTEVSIYGRNFGFNRKNVDVKMDDIDCQVQKFNCDTISFTVPVISPGEKLIALSIDSGKTVTDTFFITSQIIDTFYPTGGYDGTTITIEGSGFGSNPIVKIGHYVCDVVFSNDNQIKVISPQMPEKGLLDISVSVNGFDLVANEKYEVWSHKIFSIEYDEAKVGNLVTIHGEGFFQFNRQSKVAFGSNWAEIVSETESTIVARIPNPDWFGMRPLIIWVGEKKEEYKDFSFRSSWTRLWDFPGTAMVGTVSESYNSEAYFGLGNTTVPDGGEALNEWWKYSPDQEIWTRLSDFPGEPRSHALSFQVNDKIYVCMGIISSMDTATNELWEYDPAIDTWTQKESAPVFSSTLERTTSLKYQNNGVILSLYNERYYIYDSQNDRWESRESKLRYPIPPFSEINQWTRLRPMAFNVGDRLFWVFGIYNDNRTTLQFYEYYPEDNTHKIIYSKTLQSDFRADLTCFVIEGKAYFGGGPFLETNVSIMTPHYFEFDPDNLTIIERESFITSCVEQDAVVVGDKAYIGFGMDYTRKPNKEFWIFDP